MSDFFVRADKPAIILAPMEGVTDSHFRSAVTGLSTFTHCVTEFLRISQNAASPTVIKRILPELENDCRTPNGTPVQLQLLGGHPDRLAESALNAVKLGAQSIDLNFGCPAPTVNRHDGGATLLRYPDRLYDIAKTVRLVVPPHIPVSAKIRLGFESPTDVFENAERLFCAGISWLTIHARTKVDGYKAPAKWSYVGEVLKSAPVPVVVNGDINTLESFKRCRDITGGSHFMLGRGVLFNPFLPNALAKELGLTSPTPATYPTPEDWSRIFLSVIQTDQAAKVEPKHSLIRIKQWLAMRNLIARSESFETIKRFRKLEELQDLLQTPTRLEFSGPPPTTLSLQ